MTGLPGATPVGASRRTVNLVYTGMQRTRGGHAFPWDVVAPPRVYV
jgi:hypothetical protein